MKKTYLNLIKLLAFTFVIFTGFVISNSQKALAWGEPVICDWRDQALIFCEHGKNIAGGNSGDFNLAYDAARSKQQGVPVFKVDNKDIYLTFTSDATSATLAGRDQDRDQSSTVTVRNYLQATNPGNSAECGIIRPNGPCEGAFDAPDFEDPSGLNTENFVNSIKKLQEEEEALSQCENNKGIPLQFITCPLLDGINNTVGALIGGDEQQGTARKGLLISFLQLPPINAGQTGSVLSQVVGNVVNIANIFYILIFIILIFASSIPFLNLDSYTIKKTLPKFIAAVILTQFSIQICGIIVDFFNLLGLAIPNVIFGLISGVSFQPGGGVAEVGAQAGTGIALVVGGSALVGVLASAPVIIIILAIMALVAALTAVFYIMVRFFLLYVMIIISPLAFAAWVLPGTEKFFKQWWTNFIKLNAMFVTIMGLLSISILLSLIFRSLGSEGGNTVTTLLAGVIPIIALILVPKTLKWTTQGMNALAAGALGAVAGAGSKAAGTAKSKATGAAKEGVGEARNKAANAAFGRNNRRIGTMLGGNLPTRKGQFMASQKAASFNAEKRKINKESLEFQGSRMDFGEYQKELRNIASGKGSKRLGASRPDNNMRVSAGNILAQQGDVEHLRAMLNGGTVGAGTPDAVTYDPKTIDEKTLGEIIQPSFGDIKSAAPDLASGGSMSAYYKIGTNGITGLDASSIAEYSKHLSGPAPTDPTKLAEFQAAKNNFDARIKELSTSDKKELLKADQITQLNAYSSSAGLGVTF